MKQKYNTENNNKDYKSKSNKNNNYKNFNNLRTIGNSNNKKNVMEKILNSNPTKKIINKNIFSKSNKNNNHINHIKIKNLNFQKIKSLSNIKKTVNTANKKGKKIFLKRNSGENIISNKMFPLSPLSVKLDSNKNSSSKRNLNIKQKKTKNNIYKNVNINNINNNTTNKTKQYFIDSIINLPKNKQQIINQGIKNQLILEELNKKKNIILPFKKEINIINININGCNNTERGSLTSRDSNNKNKKKLKEYKGRNKAEINFYNQEIKSKLKNKNTINNDNLISRNDKSNPIIVKRICDNLGKNQIFENQHNSGFFTSRK